MANEYLRAFVIGSSCFVFLPYFYVVSRFPRGSANFTYLLYTLVAPVALGLMNLFSLLLARRFGLNRRMRFLAISILAPTMVALFVYFFRIYNLTTTTEWISYAVKLYTFYFVIFNVVVSALDKYV